MMKEIFSDSLSDKILKERNNYREEGDERCIYIK